MKINLNSPVEVWKINAPETGCPSCELTLFNLSGNQVVSVEAALIFMEADGKEVTRTVHRAHGLTGAPKRTFTMSIPVSEPVAFTDCEAVIEKVWYDNSSVWRRGKEPLTEYKPNNLHRSTALSELREVAGEMAAGYPEMQGDLWLCVCGRPNPVSNPVCVRCGRNSSEVFAHFTKGAVDSAIAARDRAVDDQNRAAVSQTTEMQAEREKTVTKNRRTRRAAVFAVLAIAVILLGGYGIMFHLLPHMKYTEAQKLLESGDYTAAAAGFAEISTYRDAASMVQESNYRGAASLITSTDLSSPVTLEDVEKARALVATLEDEARAEELTQECDYQEACIRLAANELDEAEALFTALGDYQDSGNMLTEITYRRLTALLDTTDDYEAVRDQLAALDGYKDSETLIKKAWYLEAQDALNRDDPVSALTCLAEIPDYADGAEALTQQAHYAYGKQLQAAGETATAAEQFYEAGDYLDAAEQASESYYAPAVTALENGKYREAARLLQNIRDYSDADDLWKQATYQQALAEMNALSFDDAAELLRQLPEDYEDVATLLKDCVYRPAQIAYSSGDYEAAIAGFTAVSDYSEAQDMIKLCNYDWAAKKAQDGDYDGAVAMYESLGDYKDSAEKINEVRSLKAQALAANGTLEDLQSAAAIYAELGDAQGLSDARYQQAMLMYDAKQYDSARIIFEALGEYGDSAERVQACDYAIALGKADEGKLDEAAELLQTLAGYSDADAQLKAVRYQQGEKAVEAGQPLEAAAYFAAAGDYRDAADQLAAQYDVYYGPIAEAAQVQYDNQEYAACADALMTVDMSQLPEKYAELGNIFRESCYQAAEAYYAAGNVYAAYPYYQCISDERRVKERLKESCYLLLGTWTDQSNNVYTFNLDGTCTLAGAELYFAVDGMTLRTGTSPDALTSTHRLTGISSTSAWLSDERTETNQRIHLTKVN